MSAVQWALLIFGVVAVVAVYVFSRRERQRSERIAPSSGPQPGVPSNPSGAPDATPTRAPAQRQMDIFASPSTAAQTAQQYDEFGVGKPRRVAPRLGDFNEELLPDPMPAKAPDRRPAREPQSAVSGAAESAGVAVPAAVPAAATSADSDGATGATAAEEIPELIVALLVAEREGTHILGEQVHWALRSQGLEYGQRQIYHRMQNGHPVFSVASLLKPGTLDPTQSRSLSTPGLTLFMVLPGPVQPLTAYQDMLATAQALGRALNAEVYDSKRKLLSSSAAQALQAEVEAWARAYAG